MRLINSCRENLGSPTTPDQTRQGTIGQLYMASRPDLKRKPRVSGLRLPSSHVALSSVYPFCPCFLFSFSLYRALHRTAVLFCSMPQWLSLKAMDHAPSV